MGNLRGTPLWTHVYRYREREVKQMTRGVQHFHEKINSSTIVIGDTIFLVRQSSKSGYTLSDAQCYVKTVPNAIASNIFCNGKCMPRIQYHMSLITFSSSRYVFYQRLFQSDSMHLYLEVSPKELSGSCFQMTALFHFTNQEYLWQPKQQHLQKTQDKVMKTNILFISSQKNHARFCF